MTPRAEPVTLLKNIDVDQIHNILEAAQTGALRDLFSLYRDILLSDSHLQAELGKRKLAVLGDPYSIMPVDKKNQDDVLTATITKEALEATPGFFIACGHLLDAVLWPVALVEKVYRPVSGQPGRYELAELVPVPHQLLDYSVTGRLRVRDVDPVSGYPTGNTQEPDPNRYIIHRGHLLTTPDNWGGPMRSLVFWWLLSVMDREWWARFLDRYGSPFLVGKYDQNDDASRSILERAFSYATKIGGLVVSKETEVEIKQAATQSSGDAYEKFLQIAQREKSKLILGQTLSAEAQSTGLGSHVAQEQGEVRSDIRQFDGMMLAQCLRDQLLTQFVRINNLPGRAPKLVWGSESADDAKAVSEMLESLSRAGLEPSDPALVVLSEKIGLEIQRSTRPMAPFCAPVPGLQLYSAPSLGQIDQIAASGAAELAQAFRGSLAPVRRIIMESHSAEECEQRIREFYGDWKPGRLVPIIEAALEAYSANGAVTPLRNT